ncbi:DUF6801 domain-containing protein [Actinomadura flavalba]|uniref:DUF6801 domain-containing protein n=1 Tax=Actinomadura flavalba TaxID=1120938 RepID=UPI0012DCC019|nr:DUF6801 domain-containing protein [Actinomadura flavalba]
MGSASADPVELKLNYTCVYPLIGSQDLAVHIKSDIPKKVEVNKPIPKIDITAISTINEDTWGGLSLIGAATLEGSAKAESAVEAPQGRVPVQVPVKLEKTNVPTEMEAFTITGTGSAPSIRFNKPGPAKVTVGNLVLNITPRDDTGAEIEVPDEDDGAISMKAVKCTLKPGQNTVLANTEIVSGPVDPDPTGEPSPDPTGEPSPDPSPDPTGEPSPDPSPDPTGEPSPDPTGEPSPDPSPDPTGEPSPDPSPDPTGEPSPDPTGEPSPDPTGEPSPDPTNPPGGVDYGFTIKGSTFVKAPNGKAPLDGEIDANLKLQTGEFTGDLKLNPTKGDFKILGFLPVTAGIKLEPQGKVTGSLKSGNLVANTKVLVKLPTFQLFGAIPLGGGENCQTAKPSDITLKSEGNFQPLKGGKLKGEYELSEIKDCNLLTPILSIFTQGKGNTLDLDLTPKAKG